jgi:hypothetical protein
MKTFKKLKARGQSVSSIFFIGVFSIYMFSGTAWAGNDCASGADVGCDATCPALASSTSLNKVCSGVVVGNFTTSPCTPNYPSLAVQQSYSGSSFYRCIAANNPSIPLIPSAPTTTTIQPENYQTPPLNSVAAGSLTPIPLAPSAPTTTTIQPEVLATAPVSTAPAPPPAVDTSSMSGNQPPLPNVPMSAPPVVAAPGTPPGATAPTDTITAADLAKLDPEVGPNAPFFYNNQQTPAAPGQPATGDAPSSSGVNVNVPPGGSANVGGVPVQNTGSTQISASAGGNGSSQAAPGGGGPTTNNTVAPCPAGTDCGKTVDVCDSDSHNYNSDACDAKTKKLTEAAVTNYKATDDCDISKNIDGSTSCTGTRAMITTTAVTTAVAQQVGSQAVSTIGQMSQQKAITQGASISTLYQSAAQMSEKASEANIAMGSAQAVMGVLETMQSSKRKKMANGFDNRFSSNGGTTVTSTSGSGNGNAQYAKETLNRSAADMGAATGSSGGTANIGEATVLNGQTQAQVGTTTTGTSAAVTAAVPGTQLQNRADVATASNLAKTANAMGSTAANEQKSVAEAASAAGVGDMAKGGAAIVSGGFQLAIAKQQAALYAAMANQVTATAPGSDPFAAQTNTISPNTISGAGTTSAAQSASTAATASPTPQGTCGPLGCGLGAIPNLGVNGPGPSPDPMVAGDGATSPGGSGAAGGSVGTSAAPPGASEDPTAKYADNGRSGVPYTGVGGYSSGSGGGNGRGNSNDPSIDPKTLMAMMTGMNSDKQEGQQAPVDITSYGRNPASDNYAPLPSGENVFQYISKSYQGLQQKGRI